jgi:hypothetical protein
LGCDGGTKRSTGGSRLEGQQFLSRADEVVLITCDGGDVNPTGVLIRFDSAEELQSGLPSAGGIWRKKRLCVDGREAFTNSFAGFEEFCREQGGVDLREGFAALQASP